MRPGWAAYRVGCLAADMQTTEGMPHRVAAAVGDYGERMAERYLRDQGMAILARNWRCALGEIDIVARDGG